MGLLDKMVGNLVRDTTGSRMAGKMARRMGAKRLILMGGAALAGGALLGKVQGQGQSQGSTMPPPSGAAPLPPLPGTSSEATSALPPVPVPATPSAELPPLPGVPTPTEVEEDDPAPDLLFPLVRTMVAAALADGELSSEERELIHDNLASGGLSPEQTSQIHKDLVIPPSPDEIAAILADPTHGEALYRAAILVVRADRQVTESEKEWLASLGAAVGLEADRLQELEEDLLAVFEGDE